MAYDNRFKIIPSVYLLLIKDGKILLSRRFQTGYEDGKYGLVAGHAEAGESFTNALYREAKEESGIEIDPKNVIHRLTMHRNCVGENHERVDFFFETDTWSGEITNMEPERCDDLSWFPLGDLPENIIPYIRRAIECLQDGTTYCEYGWSEGEVYRTVPILLNEEK
jgi:8-oxo-dGTP diphosphatase